MHHLTLWDSRDAGGLYIADQGALASLYSVPGSSTCPGQSLLERQPGPDLYRTP